MSILYPFKYLGYNIRRLCEEYWFNHKRVLVDRYYNEDTEKWELFEKKKWRTLSNEIFGSWYEGERDFVYAMEMKMAYTFFKLKRDGNHMWWYLYGGDKSLTDEDINLLYDYNISEAKKNKKDNTIEIFLKDNRKCIFNPKTGERTFYDYTIEKVPLKKPKYYTFDSKHFDKIKELEDKRTTLRNERDELIKSNNDSPKLKQTLAELNDLQKEIDAVKLEESFVPDCTEDIYHYTKSENQSIDEMTFKREVLEHYSQTVIITPQLYVKLSDTAKKECRGRRTDLQKLLRMRHLLLKAYYIDEGFTQEEIEKNKAKKKEAYMQFMNYFVENIAYIWD